jgi:hypothetical protein
MNTLPWGLALGGLAALGAGQAAPALAAPPDSNATSLEFHGALTYGTSIRTRSRDAALVSAGNGAAVGIAGAAPSGRNSDDGNLNFARHDAVSTVLKGVGSAEVKRGSAGGLLRAKFWDDLVLSDEGRPWGNTINGYASGQPLGEDGLRPRARFTGLVVQDAYVYDTYAVGGLPLYARLGQQNIGWGQGWRILGGLSALTPLDLPAVNRPGALPEESTVPFPALFGRLGISDDMNLESFYQIAYRPSELNACGTFFSAQDYNATGCNRVLLAGANDRLGLSSGLYGKRAPTPDVSDSGQFGFGVTYRVAALATEFGAYGARYHSRWPYTGAVKTTRASTPFIPGDPDGRNALYLTEYPEDIRVSALTWKTAAGGLAFNGELSYLPNQPVQINSADLLNAFSSNTAPSELRAIAAATPLGAVYHGYDRLRVTQLLMSLGQRWKQGLGGENLALSAEAGVKHAHDLPDPAVRRYGRSDLYGVGPVAGVCAGGAAQCSFDGYVSPTSWGYRLRASVTYRGVAPELDLTPTIAFASDVRGWSHDTVFIQGRRVGTVALQATYRRMYTASLAWNPTWGGAYNSMRDRSYATASVGLRF